ncbi:hypothetical protein DKT77_17115 [Meridianimarinicoccus roseus]|uniref:Uncharacterized protein n=1 Tax=Meridianimarinicoccus roseus TaxID=2072018 RepID=A0A2V2LDQ0_9RHOB|nr:hypothetical protein DKT77_17115 [Meridianimarinicoccus roseus]
MQRRLQNMRIQAVLKAAKVHLKRLAMVLLARLIPVFLLFQSAFGPFESVQAASGGQAPDRFSGHR